MTRPAVPMVHVALTHFQAGYVRGRRKALLAEFEAALARGPLVEHIGELRTAVVEIEDILVAFDVALAPGERVRR